MTQPAELEEDEMPKKAKAASPEAAVQRLRAAQAQLRQQSERVAREAEKLNRLIQQLETQVSAAPAQPGNRS